MATPPPASRRRGQQQQPYVRPPVLILTAIVLALFAVGVATLVVEQRPANTEVGPSIEEGPEVDALVGECIQVNNVDAADIAVVDCTDRQAVYKVAVRRVSTDEPCPAESYVSYTLQDELRLCLMLNARQGDCFDGQDNRVDCAAEDASYEVERVVDGVADPNECGEVNAANAIVYPEPKLTLCRVPLD